MEAIWKARASSAALRWREVFFSFSFECLVDSPRVLRMVGR
jgi:hypothetical protein